MPLPPRKQKAKKVIKPRTKPRRVKAIRCRPHLDWVVEEFDCAIKGKVDKKTGMVHVCCGPVDPDHIRTRGAGGGDEQVWPLCRGAHTLKGTIPLEEFEDRFGVEAVPMAAELWDKSPHGKAYRYQHKEQSHE